MWWVFRKFGGSAGEDFRLQGRGGEDEVEEDDDVAVRVGLRVVDLSGIGRMWTRCGPSVLLEVLRQVRAYLKRLREAQWSGPNGETS